MLPGYVKPSRTRTHTHLWAVSSSAVLPPAQPVPEKKMQVPLSQSSANAQGTVISPLR